MDNNPAVLTINKWVLWVGHFNDYYINNKKKLAWEELMY